MTQYALFETGEPGTRVYCHHPAWRQPQLTRPRGTCEGWRPGHKAHKYTTREGEYQHYCLSCAYFRGEPGEGRKP